MVAPRVVRCLIEAARQLKRHLVDPVGVIPSKIAGKPTTILGSIGRGSRAGSGILAIPVIAVRLKVRTVGELVLVNAQLVGNALHRGIGNVICLVFHDAACIVAVYGVTISVRRTRSRTVISHVASRCCAFIS